MYVGDGTVHLCFLVWAERGQRPSWQQQLLSAEELEPALHQHGHNGEEAFSFQVQFPPAERSSQLQDITATQQSNVMECDFLGTLFLCLALWCSFALLLFQKSHLKMQMLTNRHSKVMRGIFTHSRHRCKPGRMHCRRGTCEHMHWLLMLFRNRVHTLIREEFVYAFWFSTCVPPLNCNAHCLLESSHLGQWHYSLKCCSPGERILEAGHKYLIMLNFVLACSRRNLNTFTGAL